MERFGGKVALVSGAVALVLQQHPGITPDQLKKVLTYSADRLANATSADMGWGEINLAKAQSMGVSKVAYADRSWSASAGASGWTTVSPASANSPVVHVTITSGA